MSKAKKFWTVDEEISIRQVKAAVAFAIENIPAMDVWTLKKYLEYVNVAGDDALVSKGELLEKMKLIRKHLPKSCRDSLLMLAELLELAPPAAATEKGPAVAASKSEPVFRPQVSYKAALTFLN
jgi:hypothetical protein